MNTITIEGQLRSETGKKGARAVRSKEQVPGVIYGGSTNVLFSAEQKTLKPFIYTPEFMLAEVSVDGKKYKTILKDLQFDRVTDKLIHLDLLELVPGKTLLATVPLKFTGTSVGVKNGGRFVASVKGVKVKCTPETLRECLEVDITNLEIGKNLRIQDIKAEGMTLMQSPRIPICSVVTTRALKQAEADAAAGNKK
jgi:large subunit ribosomal protein L25